MQLKSLAEPWPPALFSRRHCPLAKSGVHYWAGRKDADDGEPDRRILSGYRMIRFRAWRTPVTINRIRLKLVCATVNSRMCQAGRTSGRCSSLRE